MANEVHWKHTWPSAPQLGQFVCANRGLFRDRVVVELGAGATGVPGLVAAKVGAKVVFTEHPANKQALNFLKENARENGVDDCQVRGLDWDTALLEGAGEKDGDVRAFINEWEHIDFLLASDVFYDPILFRPLVKTIQLFIDRFPLLRVYFAYHLRNEQHSIEDLLAVADLSCNLIRSIDLNSTIQLGVIYRPVRETAVTTAMDVFAGIEGGGTGSHLVFVDASGKVYGESNGPSTNMYLHGLEKAADTVAVWIREESQKLGIQLPLKALGMGLSGAEDDAMNDRFVDHLHRMHGDIAQHITLCSDSIATIAAAFEQEGVVIIAGTGGTLRLLLPDGSRFGVGGWGHMVQEEGSGFWIAQRAIRLLFDEDDGLEDAGGDTTKLRKILLEHFGIADKIGMLELMYKNFDKGNIASFTSSMAKEGAADPVIARIFSDAGRALRRQLDALAKHMPQHMRDECAVVVVGSVFKSWPLLKPGFSQGNTILRRISLYSLSERVSHGAAALGAKLAGVHLSHRTKSVLIDSV